MKGKNMNDKTLYQQAADLTEILVSKNDYPYAAGYLTGFIQMLPIELNLTEKQRDALSQLLMRSALGAAGKPV
jgi:hypothetical protein